MVDRASGIMLISKIVELFLDHCPAGPAGRRARAARPATTLAVVGEFALGGSTK